MKTRKRVRGDGEKNKYTIYSPIGFDAPKASVCFNLAPTASVVRATQRAGRVLRLDETNSEKIGTIVEFIHHETRPHNWIFFSDILNESLVLPQGDASNNIIIEGIHVIIDSEEILRLTKEHKKERGRENVEKLSWEDFLDALKNAKVRNRKEFDEACKQHPDWPVSPHNFYPEWISWPSLFEREVVEKLSWEDFVTEVRNARLKSREEFNKVYKQHRGWPAAPDQSYKKEWGSWQSLFGKEKNPRGNTQE